MRASLAPPALRLPRLDRRAVNLAIVLAFIGVLEVIDYLTGPFYTFSLLYLVPIAVLAWRMGRRAAIVAALFTVACETAADLAWPQVSGVGAYVWNTVTRAGILVLGGIVVARIRTDRDLIRDTNARLASHLAASESRFELLADTLTDHAIVRFGPDGRARAWSAATSRITRRPVHDLEGATLDDLFPPAEPRPERPLTSPHHAEERWTLRADGTRYWALLDVYDLPAGSRGRTLAVVRDMTARKNAEEEIRRARDEALAAARELETFSYTVAHDLRAPLRAIDGYGAMLQEDCGDSLDELGHAYLARMQTAARRMGRLIDDLLEMSRLGRAPLRHVPLDLSAMSRSIGDQLARLDPGRTVELDVEEGLAASGDPQLVGALLQNLLGNAWKFTSRREGARIVVGRTEDGAFYVRDDGAGFDMAYVERLFRPFERLHGVDEFEGTGIGLATVRRIVERHGGRAWAVGQVGHGATFFFTLPPPPEPR